MTTIGGICVYKTYYMCILFCNHDCTFCNVKYQPIFVVNKHGIVSRLQQTVILTQFVMMFSLLCRYEKIKDYIAPTQVNSASLHENKKVFVCGGEDFKMYKFDYETGEELGKYK